MLESEAIKELHSIRPRGGIIPQKRAEAIDAAIKALKEVEQYRSIGTPEECLAALDKQKANKPCKENTIWYCPECGEEIYWDTDYGQQKFRYCPDCGKKLNWSEEQ